MNRFENRRTISQRFHIRHIQIIFVQNVFSHYQTAVCIPFFFHRHTIHIAIHISNFENIFTQSCFHINAILVNQIRHIQYLSAVYIGTHVIIHYGDQIQCDYINLCTNLFRQDFIHFCFYKIHVLLIISNHSHCDRIHIFRIFRYFCRSCSTGFSTTTWVTPASRKASYRQHHTE